LIGYNFVMQTLKPPPLDRLLEPLALRLTPAAARALVNFRADRETQAVIAELAEKCNEGRLTPQERQEYEAFVRAIDLIAILQSKARRLLARNKKRR
jgi:hypothetical protein